MAFMVRYTQILVNQGRGIVTTLEHIKYYFLIKSAGAKRLIDYNEKAQQISDNKEFQYNFNKKEYEKIEYDSSTYKIMGSGMIETREMGYMKQIGFINELNNCVNLNEADNKFTDNKSDPNNPYLDTGSVAGNIFIMLACILRQKDEKIDKYCDATFNTLELCQSLSSKEDFPTYLKNKEPKDNPNGEGYIGTLKDKGLDEITTGVISEAKVNVSPPAEAAVATGGGALAKTRKAKRVKGGSPKKKKTKDKPRVINRIRKSRVKRNYGNKRTRCLVRK